MFRHASARLTAVSRSRGAKVVAGGLSVFSASNFEVQAASKENGTSNADWTRLQQIGLGAVVIGGCVVLAKGILKSEHTVYGLLCLFQPCWRPMTMASTIFHG